MHFYLSDGMMRTLTRHVERAFDQSRKDTNGGVGIWRGIDDGS
jgi:hypothetical protein